MPHMLHRWRMAGAALALASLAACSGGAVDTNLPATAEAPPAVEPAAPVAPSPSPALAAPSQPIPPPQPQAFVPPVPLPPAEPALAMAAMQPIPNPEDLPPAERVRIYGEAAPRRPGAPAVSQRPVRIAVAAPAVELATAPPEPTAPQPPASLILSEPVRPTAPAATAKAAPAKSGLRLDTTRSVNLEAPIRGPRPGGPRWMWLAAIAAALAGLFAWIAARRANRLSVDQRRKFRSLADRNRTVTFEVEPPKGRGFV